MSVIEAAKQDFDGRKHLVIPVEEWQTTIFATIATLKERKLIARKAGGDIQAALAECLIMKAKHEDGSAMFTREDKPALMHDVDPNIVEAIAAKIAGDYSLKEAEKN